MLTENRCAIWELPLKSLAQDGIEGFVLTGAHIQTAEREGYHLLQTFQVIGSLSCLLEKLGSEGPDVNYALDGRTCFKNFDWQRDMSYC